MYFVGTPLDVVKQLIDILVVAFAIYHLLLLTKGTRAVQIFVLLGFMLGLFLISQERLLDLATFRWLLGKSWSVMFIVVVILFQDDIRRTLSRFKWAESMLRERSVAPSRTMEEVVRASRSLSEKRMGGIFAIERSGSLDPFVSETGIELDSRVSRELLFSLFIPDRANPTHDGAVVIRKDRILAAACILPLSDRKDLPAFIGTRHRAAIGLSERVDAVVVVVSEETGHISVAVEGEIRMGLTSEELRELLSTLLTQVDKTSLLGRLKDLARGAGPKEE